jgi:hypothetical protein
MATAIGRARSARAALISTLAITVLALSAGGVAAGGLPFTVSSTSLTFASVDYPSTDVQSFTITAAKNKDAIVMAVTSNGPMTVGGDCVTTWAMQIPAGMTCTVSVTFAPLVSADDSGVLSLYSCRTFVMVGSLPACDKLQKSASISYSAVSP